MDLIEMVHRRSSHISYGIAFLLLAVFMAFVGNGTVAYGDVSPDSLGYRVDKVSEFDGSTYELKVCDEDGTKGSLYYEPEGEAVPEPGDYVHLVFSGNKVTSWKTMKPKEVGRFKKRLSDHKERVHAVNEMSRNLLFAFIIVFFALVIWFFAEFLKLIK